MTVAAYSSEEFTKLVAAFVAEGLTLEARAEGEGHYLIRLTGGY